jgi:MFS family permease
LDIGIRKGVEFYRRQNRNFKALNIRTTLGVFLDNLTLPYKQVYALELGASPVQLGYLSSIGSAFAAVFALPGGFMADRCGRKKLYMLGSIFGILTPLVYFLAKTWIWIVPAFAFSGIMNTLRQSSYEAMYSGSVKSRDRGTAFGIGSMLTSLPVILAPLVAVQIMGNPSEISAPTIRPLFLIQMVGLVLLLAFVYFVISEEKGNWRGLRNAFSARDLLFLTPFMVVPPLVCMIIGYAQGIDNMAIAPTAILLSATLAIGLLAYRLRHRSEDHLGGELRELARLPGVKAWLSMKASGAFAMGLASPFFLVYAAYGLGMPPMGLALMVTLRTLTKFISAIPWGVASDTRGRKFTFLFGRSFMHLGILCFVIASESWVLILAYALMGVADGSVSVWSVIRAELVPPRSRAVMVSLNNYVFYVPIIVSALLGGVLYSIWPRIIFILCLLIDAGLRMPLVALGVPETLKPTQSVE